MSSHIARPTWRKSSYSGQNGNCVEVGERHQGVAVRDSKNAAGPTLIFGGASWERFLSLGQR